MHTLASGSSAQPGSILGDPDEAARRNRISAVWTLLHDIKAPQPSRGDLVQVVGAASGGVLNDVACARVADAVLALWKQ